MRRSPSASSSRSFRRAPRSGGTSVSPDPGAPNSCVRRGETHCGAPRARRIVSADRFARTRRTHRRMPERAASKPRPPPADRNAEPKPKRCWIKTVARLEDQRRGRISLRRWRGRTEGIEAVALEPQSAFSATFARARRAGANTRSKSAASKSGPIPAAASIIASTRSEPASISRACWRRSPRARRAPSRPPPRKACARRSISRPAGRGHPGVGWPADRRPRPSRANGSSPGCSTATS